MGSYLSKVQFKILSIYIHDRLYISITIAILSSFGKPVPNVTKVKKAEIFKTSESFNLY